MKNVLLMVALVTIPFAVARAAVRLVAGDNPACHSCTGGFTEFGASGGPEMSCTTNNCRSGCKVYYNFFEDEYPIESWECSCASNPDDPSCELRVERHFVPWGDPIFVQYCDGDCLQRGSCAGAACVPGGTYWWTCDCNSH